MLISNERDYINLYENLLEEYFFKRRTNRFNKNKLYSLLFPVVGSKYKQGGMMICGRSTNGWCWDDFKPWKLNQINNKNKIIHDSIKASQTEWSEHEFNKRSTFWKVARYHTLKTNNEIIDDLHWSKHFVWSNLMKIAPAIRGNPTNMEFNSQVDICTDIIKYEIDFYSPKNLLFITDFDWSFDFISKLGFDPNKANYTKYTRGNYHYNKKTNIIVTVRPEFKSLEKFNKDVEKLLHL